MNESLVVPMVLGMRVQNFMAARGREFNCKSVMECVADAFQGKVSMTLYAESATRPLYGDTS